MAGARVTLREIEDEVNKSPLQEVRNQAKSFRRKSNITIEGFDFSVKNERENPRFKKKMLNVTDCQNVIIRRCKFSGTNMVDVALNITGAETKKVTVEFCIFENMTTKLDNGGEPMRLGNSRLSGCSFESIVRKCIFRNLEADPETISIKSANNIVEDCYHINNTSMITVRHGGLAEIKFNTFQGKGGIRLLGFGNKVHDNLFENSRETRKFSPIVVQNGTNEQDPNWTDVKTPSNNRGGKHTTYARCVDNEIIANEFKNCRTKIFFRTDQPKSPRNLKVDHTLPQPPIPEEGEEESGELQIPEQPEPEAATEPAEDPPTHGRLCQVGHDEEAKLRVTLYVCRRHVDDVQPRMQKLLDEIRAAANSGEIRLEEVQEEEE